MTHLGGGLAPPWHLLNSYKFLVPDQPNRTCPTANLQSSEFFSSNLCSKLDSILSYSGIPISRTLDFSNQNSFPLELISVYGAFDFSNNRFFEPISLSLGGSKNGDFAE